MHSYTGNKTAKNRGTTVGAWYFYLPTEGAWYLLENHALTLKVVFDFQSG